MSEGTPEPQVAPTAVEARREILPLNGILAQAARGWSVRVSVRAERIDVEKRVVVREQVAITPERLTEIVQVTDSVKREQLAVDAIRQVEVRDR